MNTTTPVEIYESLTAEQTSVITKKAFPDRPFPRKYVHSVFANVQDAWQAALALYAAGVDERDIYILTGSEYAEAISQGQSVFGYLTSMNYDFYLHEASRGRTFVTVRPTGYSQLKQIRDLLAPHRACLVNYIDTWTITQLLP